MKKKELSEVRKEIKQGEYVKFEETFDEY